MAEKRKRALVMHEEGARHPFRLALPREILQVATEQAEVELEVEHQKIWQNEDVHLFLFSFAAFFTAFYLFIF